MQQKYIGIQKSFFGLCKTVVFRPTQSKVKGEMFYYNVSNSNLLTDIIKSKGQALERIVHSAKLSQDFNGGLRLDCCFSDDYNFVAIQLFRYSDFMFLPVTQISYYFGEDAQLVMSSITTKQE